MKAIVIQCDGMSSLEIDESTPLSTAATPNLDWFAGHGDCGVFSLPGGIAPAGDVTHLALLGYDPQKYYTGPAPFEAASLDVHLNKGDVAFLCYFVTLRSASGRGDEKKLGSHLVLDDVESGGLETEDAREFIDALNDQLASETIQFYAGRRHRHLMVWVGGLARHGCANPYLALGKSIHAFLPTGEGAKFILELMEASRIILRNHPINEERVQAGLKPANCLWLWGPGKAVELPSFTDRFALSGVTLSPDDLHRGIGLCAGFEAIDALEEECWPRSDFQSLAERCLASLQTKDLVYLHVPMTGSCSDPAPSDLAKSIEQFDEQVIGPLRAAMANPGDVRLLVACNPSVVGASASTALAAPYVVYRKPARQGGAPRCFHEKTAHAQHGSPRDATRLIERLLARE